MPISPPRASRIRQLRRKHRPWPIERHFRPLLGKRHAHLLTDNDIRRALASIRDGKTSADIKTRKRGRARVKGGAGTARMSIDLLRVMFNFAIRERLVKANPCVGVKRIERHPRNHPR